MFEQYGLAEEYEIGIGNGMYVSFMSRPMAERFIIEAKKNEPYKQFKIEVVKKKYIKKKTIELPTRK